MPLYASCCFFHVLLLSLAVHRRLKTRLENSRSQQMFREGARTIRIPRGYSLYSPEWALPFKTFKMENPVTILKNRFLFIFIIQGKPSPLPTQTKTQSVYSTDRHPRKVELVLTGNGDDDSSAVAVPYRGCEDVPVDNTGHKYVTVWKETCINE